MHKTEESEITIQVIMNASNGDYEAIEKVIHHYDGYIRFLSMRLICDGQEERHFGVDEEMVQTLKTKLIYSVMTNFKILPE